jgi:hypothetical protein
VQFLYARVSTSDQTAAHQLQHAVASKLYAATGRGFLDRAALMEVVGVERREYLAMRISTQDEAQTTWSGNRGHEGYGYFMRDKQSAPAAVAQIAKQGAPLDEKADCPVKPGDDAGEASAVLRRQEATARAELVGEG